MNKNIRLALLHDWKADGPEQVIDLTRYDLKVYEPFDSRKDQYVSN
ncbi:DUF3864 domain-containing protein [bacterium]|nr:DUF3864 domain-containing protein [bacterium]